MANVTDRDLQELQVLAGYRQSAAIGRAAVRLDDLAGLLSLPDNLKAAKAAGATPTKAEFDALVDDVQTLQLRLRAVIAALRARRGR
jgi:hypothetical protein